MKDLGKLPRWDMTPIYPGLDSPGYMADLVRVKSDIENLQPLFDRYSVRRHTDVRIDRDLVSAFDEVIQRINALRWDLRTLRAYILSFVSTDAANDDAQSRLSELQMSMVTLGQLESRLTAWIGSMDLKGLLVQSETARAHEFRLEMFQISARHLMPEGEEHLSASWQTPGHNAWARLHNDVTSLLTVDLELRGERQTLPMSSVRALGSDPDREVRRTAYQAELLAWERNSVPLAAALNGVKGYQSIVNRRRGFANDIEPTLLTNHIDQATLEAMQQACIESFPRFRRYMCAKARALGIDRLAWYDLSAPVGELDRVYRWSDAMDFIREQFMAYSERMSLFADRSFREFWTDAEPRAGKEGGAYCMGVRPGESRILMNYDGSFTSVSTLAHELGHAYHNLNLTERSPLQSRTPMTLAETASIFCETLAIEAALKTAKDSTRIALIEAALQRDLMVVVDIYSRFLFEKRVFEGRRQRELTAREFCELMLETQRETYGDGLDTEQLHPYMWAVKGHYYGPSFYNYPYTFGLLFGLGLYARYQKDPASFRSNYDELLSNTGMYDAAELGNRFGIDIRQPDFWHSSLNIIGRNIDEFERLA